MTPIPAGLIHGIAWRLAAALGPIAHDALQHWAWCNPRTGIIGSCQPRNGRCTTCRKPVPRRADT